MRPRTKFTNTENAFDKSDFERGPDCLKLRMCLRKLTIFDRRAVRFKHDY